MNSSLFPSSPCIVCSEILQNYGDPRTSSNQPNDGLAFETIGHYGSSVLDSNPFSDVKEKIHVVICDKCVQNAFDTEKAFIERGRDEK